MKRPYLDKNTLAWEGHVFGPLRSGVPNMTEMDYPPHRVCRFCGLSTVFLTAWPESCKGVEKKETNVKLKLELVPQGRPLEEMTLVVFARRQSSSEVVLYTRLNGTDLALVGVEATPDGKLIANRWNCGHNDEGIIARDEYGRIKDGTKGR